MNNQNPAPNMQLTEQLAEVAQRFVALTDTLVADFDVVELLDQLVTDCVELINVSAAGILLLNQDDELDLVASSNEASRLIEVFQLETNQGPCIEAVSTGQAVAYTDPSALSARWPDFAIAVRNLGFSSVYAIPLRLREETIGALNLFNTDQPPMNSTEQRLCQAMADVATIGILQQRTLSRASLLTEQLQKALNSRISIEQAKGVIAEYGGIDVGEAFVAIRSYARTNNVQLSTVAGRIVTRILSPSEITLARQA